MVPFPGAPYPPMEALRDEKPLPFSDRLLEMVRGDVETFAAASMAELEFRDGLFHLRFGEAGYVFATNGLFSERLRMTLGAFLRGRGTGSGFATVLAAIHGRQRLLVTERRLTSLVQTAALRGSVVVQVRRDAILFGVPHTGWKSSYEYTSWVETLAWLDGRGLPGDDGEAVSVLGTLATALEPPPPAPPVNTGGECRFCGGSFIARDYIARERCCHGCAVSKLGVVF